MIKEKLKNLKLSKGSIIVIAFVALALILKLTNAILDTHAYYNYESGWIPIFTGKVGNFAGSGESVKQGPVNEESDVNVIFYTQVSSDTKKYKERKFMPIGGYVLNSEASNCYPAKGNEVTYDGDSYYKVNEDGSISIKYTETKPTQVTCRLYYDIDTSNNNNIDGDISVYAFIKDTNGLKEYNGGKYKFTSIVDKTWNLDGHECDFENNITKFDYTSDVGFSISSVGPNVCFAYFSK